MKKWLHLVWKFSVFTFLSKNANIFLCASCYHDTWSATIFFKCFNILKAFDVIWATVRDDWNLQICSNFTYSICDWNELLDLHCDSIPHISIEIPLLTGSLDFCLLVLPWIAIALMPVLSSSFANLIDSSTSSNILWINFHTYKIWKRNLSEFNSAHEHT